MYYVDGVNVKQRNTDRELIVAEIVGKALEKEVCLVPEISGKYKKKQTPDYLIDGEGWDLKELKEGTSKNLLRDIIHKKKRQSENFIFDITNCKLSDEEILRQAECIFTTYYNTKHAKSVIIIKGDKIVKFIRKK